MTDDESIIQLLEKEEAIFCEKFLAGNRNFSKLKSVNLDEIDP